MNSLKQYLSKVARGVIHRSETLALEGGIAFGPSSDPKGSFYSSPKLAILWYQPDTVVNTDEEVSGKGLIKGLVDKLGIMKMSA